MTTENIVYREILKNIQGLPDDDRIRVECIARTLRSIVGAEGENGRFAMALVGAELSILPLPN